MDVQMIFSREQIPGEENDVSTYSFDDFKKERLIGKGTFGKVYLVKNAKENSKIYAMKSIRKDAVIEHDSLARLRNEKLIML